MTGSGFGTRLAGLVARRGPLCVGIDPHPALLRQWGLDASVAGLERFARSIVDTLAGEVAVLKPQSAFFEAYGSAGIGVLERVLADCRAAGTLSLLDVKRGDIGSTMAAYAQAYLADGAVLRADAITASPYLGFGALAPALETARANGRGVFVLAMTSNPEGTAVQRAWFDGVGVAQAVIDAAGRRNAEVAGYGDTGVVIGATIGDHRLDLSALGGPILAPGFGAQGAGPEELKAVFGAALPQVLPASARDVLRHGPDPAALRTATRRIAAELRGPTG
ncbi:MAG: orotidine-5'-phosphate decarboxylase [Sciscionella sp.]